MSSAGQDNVGQGGVQLTGKGLDGYNKVGR